MENGRNLLSSYEEKRNMGKADAGPCQEESRTRWQETRSYLSLIDSQSVKTTDRAVDRGIDGGKGQGA